MVKKRIGKITEKESTSSGDYQNVKDEDENIVKGNPQPSNWVQVMTSNKLGEPGEEQVGRQGASGIQRCVVGAVRGDVCDAATERQPGSQQHCDGHWSCGCMRFPGEELEGGRKA